MLAAALQTLRLRFLLPFGLMGGLVVCVGPAAPDPDLCRDTIHRLCLPPVCADVTGRVAVDAGTCEETLLTRTGCGSDGFKFVTPTRERFIECRVPLVRAGVERDTAPDCNDVLDAFNACPDLVHFLGGGT